MTMKLVTLPAIALIAVVGGAALLLGPDRSGAESHGASAATSESTDMAQDAEKGEIVEMTMGAEDAPVTLIEYASFTCPHCANFHGNQLKQLKADYIDTGKVRFVYRDVYFDRIGLWASMVARCEADKFFGVADLIYARQGEWLDSNDPVVLANNLRKLGMVAGLSEEQVSACMLDADKAKALVTWFEENQKADNVRATPSIMVDGVMLESNSWEVIKAALDAKLEG